LGVIGFGCLFNSTTFFFIIVPLLFTGSLIYNRFLQEKICEKKFGKAYLEYRKNVPFIIPHIQLIFKNKNYE
jgi:protein-S-isoprenylcysteine O-methyltransferase Ste14